MTYLKKCILSSFVILSIEAAFAGCPAGYMIASPTDVRANLQAACQALGKWDIARLRGNASISGPGYDCAIKDVDPRALGNALCKQPVSFKTGKLDICPDGYTIVDPYSTIHYSSIACAAINTWDVVRLDGNGSMDGKGYLCGIRVTDTRPLGKVLCANYIFKIGDNSL